MAFGTKGDVLPIAAIATALACDQPHYRVILITHSAHQDISAPLATKNVIFIPVSSPPVLPVHQVSVASDSELLSSFSLHKKAIQTKHRQECLLAIERAFGDVPSMEGDFVAINFFALEGWSLAELYQVPCVVAAPYVVPYSAPSSFGRRFKLEFPLLYKYLQEASANKVCWKDVIHWMWPLFSEDWGSWRSDCLNLSPLPFTDPVTNLPISHVRAESTLLLYGFSKEIVECPGYWPSDVHVCGFWFLPMDWQFSCPRCREIFSRNSCKYSIQKNVLCADHAGLQHFLNERSSPYLPVFVGLSSIGSMGFLRNPRAFLLVLRAVSEISNYRIILLTAGYEPLDAAIQELQQAVNNKNGNLLFSDRLFCFSGSIPYRWLFPRCAVAIHHGGSGSTAAALHAGIPQIVCPFILDQFYWAERLSWLGVAPEPLQQHYLVPDTDDATCIAQAAAALSMTIEQALTPKIKEQASRIAERISSEDGVGKALKVLKEKVICLGKERSCSLKCNGEDHSDLC